MAFETNLAPFWEGFGSQVGAKLAPSCFKNRSKKSSKKWSHFGSLLDRFLIDLGLQLRRPRGSYEMGLGALGVILGHLGAKMAPRPLQEGLGTDFWPIFVDFWTNFGWFYFEFWLIFGPILIDVSTYFGIWLPALLNVWAYVGHVAHVTPSSNPKARWRGWPEGQLDMYMYVYIHHRALHEVEC